MSKSQNINVKVLGKVDPMSVYIYSASKSKSEIHICKYKMNIMPYL